MSVVRALVTLSLAVLCWAGDVDLREYVRRFDLGQQHVGVGYDVVKGATTTQHLLLEPQFDVDPLVHSSITEVYQLKSLRQLHEIHAARTHLDFHRGMFVKAPLPLYAPDETQGSWFYSMRTDELLAVKLKGEPRAIPELETALAALPDSFDAKDVPLVWTPFFERFPMHWTESAFIGGSIVVSSNMKRTDAQSQTKVKRFLDQFLRDGHVDDSLMEWAQEAQHYVRNHGGDSQLIKSRPEPGVASRQHLMTWEDSLRHRPALVRFGVKSIGEQFCD